MGFEVVSEGRMAELVGELRVFTKFPQCPSCGETFFLTKAHREVRIMRGGLPLGLRYVEIDCDKCRRAWHMVMLEDVVTWRRARNEASDSDEAPPF